MSLSPQTLRIRTRVAQWTKQGRKHWDLYPYLSDPYLLFDATKLVIANGGAAGVDGQSNKELIGREWEFAIKLSGKIRQGSYRPVAVKRVYIPKSNGERRPLGIPTVVDRIVQRALCLLLEMIYEQKFHEFSCGFRPKRRAVDCVAEVAKVVSTHRFVLEADIANFFDRVSHNLLLKLIEREIVDPRVTRLIARILKAGVEEIGKPWEASREGTPQGGPLSPMLANIYLHYLLDEKFVQAFGHNERVKLFRFADDFVIVCVHPWELKAAKRLLSAWMTEAKLILKETKTREVDMTNYNRSHDSKFDFLGFKLHLRAYKDNRRRFWIARQPSEKSRHALRQALRERAQAHLPPDVVKLKLVATWRGWCNYFRHSNGNRVIQRERDSVKHVAWWYLRRKFRRSGKPVAWSRLTILAEDLMTEIRPVRVCNDSVREKRQQSFEFGRA
jgi:group II intron reverse transcriptase/maturase